MLSKWATEYACSSLLQYVVKKMVRTGVDAHSAAGLTAGVCVPDSLTEMQRFDWMTTRQHTVSGASILPCSVAFIKELSYPEINLMRFPATVQNLYDRANEIMSGHTTTNVGHVCEEFE